MINVANYLVKSVSIPTSLMKNQTLPLLELKVNQTSDLILRTTAPPESRETQLTRLASDIKPGERDLMGLRHQL
jgi:hypothetical protein